MVTYRGVAKSNRVRTEHLLSPSFKLEFKRDSKKALTEATKAYVRLLADTLPDNGATAWFERSDSRGYRTVLASSTGKATKRDPVSGRVLEGGWETDWKKPL